MCLQLNAAPFSKDFCENYPKLYFGTKHLAKKTLMGW